MSKTKQEMEARMSQIAGLPVDITIRGDHDFTFHFDGISNKAIKALQNFFCMDAQMEVVADEECGTCVYISF